jgi:hypothetical protein
MHPLITAIAAKLGFETIHAFSLFFTFTPAIPPQIATMDDFYHEKR